MATALKNDTESCLQITLQDYLSQHPHLGNFKPLADIVLRMLNLDYTRRPEYADTCVELRRTEVSIVLELAQYLSF